ncbi:hypothetical protein HID58_089722 [Brassica napus]|uniref:MADS-box domain-containing protein n=3 Tax=Brassica TaxID=3705 RepID=A0ABQ7Y2M4_BRANA|nr:hypothetical protein HID58_089722 [Brassica napus]
MVNQLKRSETDKDKPFLAQTLCRAGFEPSFAAAGLASRLPVRNSSFSLPFLSSMGLMVTSPVSESLLLLPPPPEPPPSVLPLDLLGGIPAPDPPDPPDPPDMFGESDLSSLPCLCFTLTAARSHLFNGTITACSVWLLLVPLRVKLVRHLLLPSAGCRSWIYDFVWGKHRFFSMFLSLFSKEFRHLVCLTLPQYEVLLPQYEVVVQNLYFPSIQYFCMYTTTQKDRRWIQKSQPWLFTFRLVCLSVVVLATPHPFMVEDLLTIPRLIKRCMITFVAKLLAAFYAFVAAACSGSSSPSVASDSRGVISPISTRDSLLSCLCVMFAYIYVYVTCFACDAAVSLASLALLYYLLNDYSFDGIELKATAMGIPKVKLAWVEERKRRATVCQRRMKELIQMAEELTIVCDTSACLVFYNRNNGKLVGWPSLEEAQSLIDCYNALPETERNMNADDEESSFIKTITKEIEKKLELSRKAVEELKMDNLMLQIKNGSRMIADLSQTEIEKLKSYASKKIAYYDRELRKQHPNTSGNEPFLEDDDGEMKTYEGESSESDELKATAMETPKLKLAVEELEMDHLMLQIQNGRMLDDLSQTETEKLKSYAIKKCRTLCGEIPMAPGFPMIQGGSVYLMDKWIKDPSDKEDEMKTCEGESSKSGAMGRPKVKLAWVEERKRRATVCQRRMKELIQMAEELTIVCDMSACLVFYNRNNGKLVAWPSLEEAQSLIDCYNALPETERNMNADDEESSFIKTITKEIEKKLELSRKAVEELKMDNLMLQIKNGSRMIADLSQTEIEKLKSYASKKIAYYDRELRKQHPNTSGNEPFLEDDDGEMKTYEGESSESDGADNA